MISTNRASDTEITSHDDAQPSKRRRTGDAAMRSFLERKEISHDTVGEASISDHHPAFTSAGSLEPDDANAETLQSAHSIRKPDEAGNSTKSLLDPIGQMPAKQTPIDLYFCSRCDESFLVKERDEHEDWHYARDLQARDRGSSLVVSPANNPSTHGKSVQEKKKTGRGRPNGVRRSVKGQTRLAFGS